MTTRYRRYLGFARARRPRTITTYGVHVLDNLREEIMPRYQREAAADDPWLHPEKSDTVQECLWRIEQAAAHTRISESEESEFDIRGLCEDAELSPRETDVLCLAGSGWSQCEIAAWLEVNQATVSRRLSSGRRKLAGWLPLEVAYRLAVA